MDTSTFEVRQRGIKAFPEGNRIDFKLEAPGEEPLRATVFFNSMDREVKLDNHKLSILPPDRNDDGSLKNPNRLSIRWGRRIINLGLVQKRGIKPYYYRGLETANDQARPQTPDDLFSAMGFDQ